MEVDALGTQINEDVSNLKHECVFGPLWWTIGYSPQILRIQMELGNRKNEAKNELKRQDIVIEVDHLPARSLAVLTNAQSMYNKTMGSLGDLKTEVEEAKWDNMRKSVGTSPTAYQIHAVPWPTSSQPLFRVSSSSSSWAWSSPPSPGGRSRRRPRMPNLNHGTGPLQITLPSPRIHSKPQAREPNNTPIRLEI